MKKTTKRVLALALALALCTALMLPGFAETATTNTANPHMLCYHDSGQTYTGVWTGGYYYANHHSYAEHGVGKTYWLACSKCGTYVGTYNGPEDHLESHQVPCGKCGFNG